MIKAILIDDEMHCLKTLGLLLAEYCPNVQVLEKCNDAVTGLKAIEMRCKGPVVMIQLQV